MRTNFSNWVRTPLLPSRINGRRFGNITLTGWGRGVSTGREPIDDVRWERDSFRWVSDFADRRERWWENCDEADGAPACRDCWFRTIPLIVYEYAESSYAGIWGRT